MTSHVNLPIGTGGVHRKKSFWLLPNHAQVKRLWPILSCKNLIRFLLFITKALNDFPLHIELTLCYLIGKRWRGMLVIRDSW